MRILLLSLNAGAIASFLDEEGTGHRLRLGYVTDAQVAYEGAPFVSAERERVLALGHDVVWIEARGLSPAQFDETLATLDAVYVASGSTFALLEALRTTGNDAVLVRHVRAGLPYIGSSAGSIIAGPDVEPLSLMDDPADGPLLPDTAGLGLIETTVVPHADGALPPYPIELIHRVLATYGAEHALRPLRDDQALLVTDAGEEIIASVA